MAVGQFQRPETALTKAKELIKCDKKANALEILFEVMRARRSKVWQKVLEELMMLLVELCVELRKSLQFRKAIYQYRNISLLENTSSFENVLRLYLSMIKTKTDEAQQESKCVSDIDDLDAFETPESLMLNAVSLEDAQDRSARSIVMPWLKFLWDSYRLSLDLLRGNSKLERLYHEITNDGLFQVPTRKSLVHDLIRYKVSTFVPPELAKFFQVLEDDFQPLNLSNLSSDAMTYIKNIPELNIYTTQLQEVIVAKTILQLSQVYQTIKFDRIVELCPFMDRLKLERCVMELVRNLELPISINHRLQSLVFDKFTDLGISHCDYGGQLVSNSTHVNAPDRLSRQLTLFAQVMHQITEMLNSEQGVPTYRLLLLNQYRTYQSEIRRELLQRRDVIEVRKEQMELYLAEQDQFFMNEQERRRNEQKQQIETEEQNLQKEAEERERRKVEEEEERLKRRINRERLKVVASANIGLKDLTEDQLDKINAEELLDQKSEEVKRKHKELSDKAKAMYKKLEYFTRAVRLEEIPLLQAQIEPDARSAKEFFERTQKEVQERSRNDHERSIKERERLERMKVDVQGLVGRLKSARDARYNDRLGEWKELCASTYAERVAELKAQREAQAIEEARLKAEQEAEAKRLEEEAAEAERRRQEEKAREAAEREALRTKEMERVSNQWINLPADQNESKEPAPASNSPWVRGQAATRTPQASTGAFQGRYRQSEGNQPRQSFNNPTETPVNDWKKGSAVISKKSNTPSSNAWGRDNKSRPNPRMSRN